MSLGMEMMLKNMLGIDPEEIKRKMDEGVSFLNATVKMIDTRLTAIEDRLAGIEAQLQEKDESNG